MFEPLLKNDTVSAETLEQKTEVDVNWKENENDVDENTMQTNDYCRFCCFRSRNTSNEAQDFRFIHLYEKTTDDAPETLDVVINRYLPIKICENDLHYPKVICSTCYESVEKTVAFFDKIIEGQKLLGKLIGQIDNVTRKYDATSLSFSAENPMLISKRKRGRPRKDPNKPYIPKPIVSECIERTKRHSRLPARYAATDLCTTLIKDEFDDRDEFDENKNDEFAAFLSKKVVTAVKCESSEIETVGSVHAGTKSVMSIGLPKVSSSSNSETLTEFVKLNVIMDGDDESEPTVPNVENEGSLFTTSNQIRRTIPKMFGSGESVGIVTIALEEEPHQSDIIFIREQIRDSEEKVDSDTSVKLTDLIRRTKKSSRRKRVTKRVGKSKSRSYAGRNLNCPNCEKTFSNPSSLLYHQAAAHDQVRKYVCPTCKKGFTHKQLLTNHLYTHLEEKCFACDICSSKFKSRASLYTHKKSTHTSKKEFTCEKCGVQFNLKSSLKVHMRLHSGEKPYACEFCQKRFAQRSNMREHIRTHTGEKPYICDLTPNCNKSFTTSSQLRNHKSTHSGLKPFLCSICGKGFANGENFKYHMIRHEGHRPLECPVCQKQFVEPWSLKKHWRLHTGEKPYQCPQCHKVFADPSNYSKHKKMHSECKETIEEIQVQGLYDNSQICTIRTNSKNNMGETQITDRTSVTEYDEQIVSSTPNIETDGVNLGEGSETQSLVHILNAENLTALDTSQDGPSSVIYVYPGDVPVYTITLADNQQTIEVRADDEAALQHALGTLAGGPITFTTVDPGEITSQYLDLESLDGSTTVMVPTSQLSVATRGSSLSQLRSDDTTEIIVPLNVADVDSTAS